MRAGDFAVVRGKGWASDIVSDFEQSPWSHVVSVLDADHYLDPVWPIIVARIAQLPPDSSRLYCSPKLTDAEREEVGVQLRRFVGKPYGIGALIWAGLCIYIPPLRRFHDPILDAGVCCSTALATAYWRAGVYDRLRLPWQEPESVTPADLAAVWDDPIAT